LELTGLIEYRCQRCGKKVELMFDSEGNASLFKYVTNNEGIIICRGCYEKERDLKKENINILKDELVKFLLSSKKNMEWAKLVFFLLRMEKYNIDFEKEKLEIEAVLEK
jgi:hypothetical protein